MNVTSVQKQGQGTPPPSSEPFHRLSSPDFPAKLLQRVLLGGRLCLLSFSPPHSLSLAPPHPFSTCPQNCRGLINNQQDHSLNHFCLSSWPILLLFLGSVTLLLVFLSLWVLEMLLSSWSHTCLFCFFSAPLYAAATCYPWRQTSPSLTYSVF